ncbi:MAG: hypothetical protein ACAH95_17280 [Fimbriimonas sp.]
MSLFAKPRFAREKVEFYAARYSYGKEEAVSALVPTIRARGFLTLQDLAIVGDWKSPRIRSRLAQNDDKAVREVTRLALASSSIRLAVHVPQVLTGVGMPVASTLLHWFHRDSFPILDFRALWSLGVEPQLYTLDFWERYVTATRSLAESWEVDMRTLDKALWQYSAEHQP